MANPAKSKGDRAERAAVSWLLDTVPELCVPKAQRMLGAGRAEDVGDLHVFSDVAVQVRAYQLSSIGAAVRSSALDSVTQAGHGDRRFGVGMVPYPRARPGTVKWLAATTVEAWPGGTEPVRFAMVSKALAWVRDDGPGQPGRNDRVALLASGSAVPVLVAPFEAWLAAYRASTVASTHVEGHTPFVKDFAS